MALTAPVPLPKTRSGKARGLPRWGAGILAIAGNIMVLGIVAAAAAATLAAAAFVFGTAFLAHM